MTHRQHDQMGESEGQPGKKVSDLLMEFKLLTGDRKVKIFNQLYWLCWEVYGKEADLTLFISYGWTLYALQDHLISLIVFAR